MKKHILSVVLAFFAFAVFSQTENQKIDGKFRFGFNLATNYSLLRSEESLTSNSKITLNRKFKKPRRELELKYILETESNETTGKL
jgi:hypothetical protein